MFAYYVLKNNRLVIYSDKYKTIIDAEKWFNNHGLIISKLLNRNFILQEIKK